MPWRTEHKLPTSAPETAPPARPPFPPVSDALPPLVLGTATFNTQYVSHISALPYTSIVARALQLGIRAFDTSPYYGPSEQLLGYALYVALASLVPPSGAAAATSALPAQPALTREDLFLVTKVGRVASSTFDYSPAAVRASVRRSLARLGTSYVDLVYAHDVEFQSPEQVLAAVTTLRELRDNHGIVRYVGISGFPLPTLCSLAEYVLAKTGEPLDAVLSYGHCTVQNATLTSDAVLARLRTDARVGTVLNASMLNMGLLTTRGVDAGPQAAWHPSPAGLRDACARAAKVCAAESGEHFEGVAIRWSLDEWARRAGEVGLGTRVPWSQGQGKTGGAPQSVGSSVIGVTTVPELEETVREWQGVVDGLGGEDAGEGDQEKPVASLARREQVRKLVADKLWPALGDEWRDYSWTSPPAGWVNVELHPDGPVAAERK
ncbi:uncharacterized protein E0L32_002424 [Thyridium curvatum]|uniref:NADP-dependent oxidoreductase domain-containing protein n=1 Tax=Thyridium curvatum TaxID=1093900 RepID=A0A507BF24_9PEZI|nr:uncharacterized protein E0L32_002424 [Thyridium curvatum]TPX18567.1 hypothetical protein E0L32_002424 [Thyridium curvatum]